MAKNDGAATGKKPSWFKQIWGAYKLTRETDPAVTLWTVGPFVLIIALAVAIALLTNAWWLSLMLGVPIAFVVALFSMVHRAEKAAYQRIAGRPGASLNALTTIRTGQWTWEDEPVAYNKTGEMIFRGVGRGGVLLIAEGGNDQRAAKLADGEVKKVKRVVLEAPVSVIRVGEGPDQVPLPKLSRYVTKMKPVLSKTETVDVSKRLKTLSAKRPLPIPKGIDPFNMRPDRRGMRGR